MYESLPSPNHNERPDEPVSVLVLHYTGMPSAGEALARLVDPESKVSAHYVVTEGGVVYQLVEEHRRAWHAGVSCWKGRNNLNDVSIGIEIVNPGHEFGYRPFPEVQMEAVAALCSGILGRHGGIIPGNVVGHSDIAPERKEDPGELFPWGWLAEQGIGNWPKDLRPQEMLGFKAMKLGDAGAEVARLRQQLKAYGYCMPDSQVFDNQLEKIVVAFQRRFRFAKLDGTWDDECQQILDFLLEIS